MQYVVVGSKMEYENEKGQKIGIVTGIPSHISNAQYYAKVALACSKVNAQVGQ